MDLQNQVPDWIETVNDTALALSVLSLILSGFTIATFLIFPVRRRYPVRLPLYLCIATFGLSLSSLLTSKSLCSTQSIGIYFFGTACWVWWGIISFNFYDVMVRGNVASFDKREGLYNIIGWSVPTVFTIVAKASDTLATERPLQGHLWECFLNARTDYSDYLIFYGWLGAMCLVALFIWPQCLWKVYRGHLYSSLSRAESLRMLAYSRHMFFMIIFFVYFAILLALHIEVDVHHKRDVILANTIAVTSIGMYTFLLFGCSMQSYQLWKGLILQRTVTPKLGDNIYELSQHEAPLDIEPEDVYMSQSDSMHQMTSMPARHSVSMYDMQGNSSRNSESTKSSGENAYRMSTGRAYSAEFHAIDDLLGVRGRASLSMAAAAAAAAATGEYQPPELGMMLTPTEVITSSNYVGTGPYDVSSDLYAASVYLAGKPLGGPGDALDDMGEGMYSIIGQSPSTFDPNNNALNMKR